ncbi:hypothetical protein F5884DRAFT_861664 [Xylogone sp. PMI_703]|nr:hypothetical protein F5884DRAFT_861664 [Xylogone sp. PMI_703]
MAITSSSSEVLTFVHNPFKLDLRDSFNNIPRYLFRLYAPSTAGTTSISNVTSPAWGSGKADQTKDLFQRSQDEAAGLLYRHLAWDKAHEQGCNLMSWTSSLLFAIQYGLYRHRKDFDYPELSRIFVLVLDTQYFPKGTFIKDLEAIKAFQENSKDLQKWYDFRTRKEKGKYYFGEYLTQGNLNTKGKCTEASVQQMIDLGLFDLNPEMGERAHWDEWASQVVKLRSVFRESYLVTPTENSEVRKAITLAQGCFGNRWAFPIAAMLLSFKPRQQDDLVIVAGFRAMFTDTEIKDLSLGSSKIDSAQLPEVQQYENIIKDLIRHLKGGDMKLLLNPFEQLRVSAC